jgi:hypothetical protein
VKIMSIKKILIGTTAGALMLGAMIAPAFAAAPNWNITGAWDLNFVANVGAIGTYQHHMDVTQAPNGTLSGTGYYIPAPSYTWVIDPGSMISENNVHINLHYTAGHPTTWTTTVDAKIDCSGYLSGTWKDNQGDSG